ncbi:zinc finger protein 567-like isoform X2 [Pseudomyrmex gracilis]|uniref:zinc finger protein 567-like isoform X2 n=1 Tax=Pseudomyrmex gracilis TaxID=219809 RepID=UPI000994DB9D|nr:zinc finger protein 567-like isoform X2 [Pseudomyrmex gracilis]
MYFSEDQTSGNDQNNALPQFSELRSTLSAGSLADYTNDGNMQMQAADTTAYTIGLSQKQLNSPNKNTASISWSDAILQLINSPIMNIPTCSQNNSLLGIQANNLPTSIINSTYLPSTSQADVTKQDLCYEHKEQEELDKQKGLTEIFQKLQAAGISSSWQQLIKPQIEQIKKEKGQEKPENMQNSILNIPMVFRNTQLQSSNNFCNSDHLAINTDNLNMQLMNEQQENESNVQTVLKVEQQVQTDFPTEKKPRFRAKLDVKISVSSDGTVFYCCPECAFRLQDKAEMEQHIQTHLQERKYPCTHCDAKLKRKEHLDQHMRGHSDDRPFKCNLCPKAFKRNEHLTRHRSIHSGNKNFFCQICNKGFSRKDHLNKHQQTHLGTRKKKENSYFVDQKEMMKVLDKSSTNSAPIAKQEVSLILPDDYLKQSLIQHIQKDPNLLQTFTSLKQAMRENALQQAQGINLNELMSHNTRHLT